MISWSECSIIPAIVTKYLSSSYVYKVIKQRQGDRR
jgi:hypothetical protein